MLSNPILELADLSIRFGEAAPVVHNLNCAVAAGQTLALVGESGSGKSLTALAIMGLLPKGAAASGTITLKAPSGNVSLLRLDRHDWQLIRGQQAGLVFQEPMSALNPLMTIGDQLTEAIRQHQAVSNTEARQQALQWLRDVQLPHPDTLYKRYPHQLSGGQKQRVIIAMALCNRPALVIADEPTTALDATVQLEIVRLLQTLQQKTGTALLFITHDLALAREIADTVLVLYRGETMEYGPAATVFQNPQHPYTKALLQCRPDATAKGKQLPQVSDFLNGFPEQGVRIVPSLALSEATPEVLQVKDLSVVYGAGKNVFRAVDTVSFTLRQGEVLGLVGESGCGKSTVAKALMGLVPLSGGTVALAGTVPEQKQPRIKALRRQMQLVFQDPAASLNPRMTVLDAIAEPMIAHRIYKAREARAEAARLLEQVGLPVASGTKYPHEFSGGQKQRVGIARALSLRPKILICDESVSALDVSVQAQILNLLQDLRQELKLSYLFISHDLQVVHYISDRVLVMQAGRVVESGLADAVLRHPEHPYTRKLVAASNW